MKQYYVLREYNGPTAKKTLWEVITRPLKSIVSARDWLDSEKKMRPMKNKEWFIVERLTDEEVAKRIAAGEQFNLD